MLDLEMTDGWDGIAGWASAARNDAWARFLTRRAPGARVLEFRAGAGLWAVMAARLGARRVIAVEPSELADVARELVAANGLGAIVEVREAWGEPEPVEVAWTSRIPAEPFTDGLLRDAERAAAWLAPGGVLAPRRLRVLGAAADVRDPATEAADARDELDRWAATWGLDLSPVRATLADAGAYRSFTDAEDPIAAPSVIWELILGTSARPRPRVIAHAGPSEILGCIQWFEAEIDDELTLGGPPGTGSPWPPLVCGWAEPAAPRLRWSTSAGQIVARPAPPR